MTIRLPHHAAGAALLLLLAFVAAPRDANAQSAGDPQMGEPIHGFAGGQLRLSGMAGQSVGLGGGRVGLLIRDSFRLGAAAWVTLDGAELGGGSGGSGTALKMDVYYWGVAPAWRLDLAEGWDGSLGVLIGAGNARVSSQFPSAELGAVNFFVMEPEAEVRFRPWEQFGFSASLGYRYTGNVDRLPGIQSGGLGGFTVGLGAQVGR